MMEYKRGDLLKEEVEVLVNPVNCAGVMGKGLALQFKKTFPDNFRAYAAACAAGEVVPGKIFVHPIEPAGVQKYIFNFPTKRHWRGKSRMEDITAGLADLVRLVGDLDIASIAVPPLGAGLGGLDWHQVEQALVEVLSPLAEVRIVIFEPL